MSAADIQAKAFTDDNVAREAIEALMWPDGPVCPHCGCIGKIGKIASKSARPGLYYCGDCKKQFTVTVGTIFERSKVPLSKWWMAIHLMASSKKGMSAHQMHRMLGIHYQTAWFMEHRIREAMRDGNLSPLGGSGSIVESDETFIGRKEGFEIKQGYGHKNAVLTLVERGGSARSFHVERVSAKDIGPIVQANIARESRLMTDEANYYTRIGARFASHHSVDHSRGEYAWIDKPTGLSVHSKWAVCQDRPASLLLCAPDAINNRLDKFFRDSHRYFDEVEAGKVDPFTFDLSFDDYEEYKIDDFNEIVKAIIALDAEAMAYWNKILRFSLLHERERRKRPL